MKNEQKNKPKIRFPEYSSEWKHRRLNELLFESKKRNFEQIYSKDEVLSVSRELGIINQIEHLGRSYAGESVHNYHVVDVGDIVYTKSPLKNNPYGIIKVNQSKVGIVSTLYAVYKIIENEVDGLFLDYYFSLVENTNNYLRPLVRKGAKNDMKVNNAYVLHEKIFVPTINEQKRIKSFLFAVDKRIQILARKKALLEQYKKGILQQLFTQKIRFKDAEGKQFPKWGKLNGKSLFYSHSNKNHNGELRILAATQEYGVVPRDTIGIDIKSSENSVKAYKIVEKGDFVISLRSFQGGIEYSNYYGICSPAYTILKPKVKIDDLFFKYYFKKEDFIKRLSQTVVGIRDGKQISYDAFSGLKLVVPTYQEQKRISKFIKVIDDRIQKLKTEIETTELYKKGLLQQMYC